METPGVPASTVASVQQTRYAFEQSKQTVDQAIASVVSFASWTARAAGFLAGAMVYGLDSANEGYWEFARAAENAASAAERQAAAAAPVARTLRATIAARRSGWARPQMSMKSMPVLNGG